MSPRGDARGFYLPTNPRVSPQIRNRVRGFRHTPYPNNETALSDGLSLIRQDRMQWQGKTCPADFQTAFSVIIRPLCGRLLRLVFLFANRPSESA
ncbi:hypothetical protein, partial [Neisseria bacilliformis]|uniref:hypothetical protein n=1 Tax=Neisseria bacilliformis TaxID=267212 RepID=UPI003C729855